MLVPGTARQFHSACIPHVEILITDLYNCVTIILKISFQKIKKKIVLRKRTVIANQIQPYEYQLARVESLRVEIGINALLYLIFNYLYIVSFENFLYSRQCQPIRAKI